VVWVSLIWMYWTEVRRANPMGDPSKTLSLQS
jgi:MFS transporter, NNP family, nitrate/nitrite transporter